MFQDRARFPWSRRHVATALARAAALFQSPALKADAAALLFSARSFAAAMLAYYIALRIGLPRPNWSVLTVYIVSQPTAGATFGRGLYRLAGTLAGAAATVAIIPNFANEPMLCSVVLAAWIGFCLYLSLLDRTARSYAFVLAGYTTSLIGFPSVADPGAIFDTASARVQEISLGILCAVVLHRLLLPRTITDPFLGKLAATMRDARRLVTDMLSPGGPTGHDRRRQLAADLLALQGLAGQLPYDPVSRTPQRSALRLIHDRLARLLPLSIELEDRVRASRLPDDLAALLYDARIWSDTPADLGEPIDLIERARALQGALGASAQPVDNRIAANLAGRVAELVALLHDCDRLEHAVTVASGSVDAGSLHGTARPAGYVYHRDHVMAARAALGAATGIFVGCALWIWSGWTDGSLALMIVGVACALFGNIDTPGPAVVKYWIGSIYAVGLGLLYSFVILPRVTDFPVLVAVLAPVLLFAGSLQARPQAMLLALGILLSFPILIGLGTAYTADFAEYLNSAVALCVGTGFALVSMSLFQTVPVDTTIRRLLRVSRRDVARRARGGAPDERRWTSLMIDRTALLAPRLRMSRRAYPDLLDDTMHHLVVGHAVGRLRRQTRSLAGPIRTETEALLSDIAARFDGSGRNDPGAFIQRIDRLASDALDIGPPGTIALSDMLMDLRFALAPAGAADGQVAP